MKLETIFKNKEIVSLKIKEIEDGISKLKSTIEKDKNRI